MKHQIKHLRLSDIQPDPKNAKAHDLTEIDASINRFGVIETVVQDARTGLLIAGHGRTTTLQAMHARGDTPPEGVQVDDDGDWLIPVLTGWSSKDDNESAAALIALNRTTELGGWVDDALLGLLEELSTDPDGLIGVGFDESDIALLKAQMSDLDDELPDIDDGGFTKPGQTVECPECGHTFKA